MPMLYENSREYGMRMGVGMVMNKIEEETLRQAQGKEEVNRMFSLKAPKDMFRVIGEDIRQNNSWLNGDFHTKEEAIDIAHRNHGDFVRMHVYNDAEEKIFESNFFKPRFIN